jgi:hypothetical protein
MSPATIVGRYLAFCSGVPNFMITGPTMRSPMAKMRGASAAIAFAREDVALVAVQPVPPYSLGQLGADQPRLASTLCQRWPAANSANTPRSCGRPRAGLSVRFSSRNGGPQFGTLRPAG